MHGISLAILAGGQSSRFGSNKALTEIGGRTIVERVIDAAQGLADESFIVTNTPEAYERFGLRMAADLMPSGGALRGLHTAMSAARERWVLCLACDMPFAQSALLRHLCACAGDPASAGLGGVVPRHAGGAEPLCAIYDREVCLPAFAPLFEANRYRLIGLYESVPIRYVEPPELLDYDPELLSFFNVNTQADLAEAAALARERGL